MSPLPQAPCSHQSPKLHSPFSDESPASSQQNVRKCPWFQARLLAAAQGWSIFPAGERADMSRSFWRPRCSPAHLLGTARGCWLERREEVIRALRHLLGKVSPVVWQTGALKYSVSGR